MMQQINIDLSSTRFRLVSKFLRDGCDREKLMKSKPIMITLSDNKQMNTRSLKKMLVSKPWKAQGKQLLFNISYNYTSNFQLPTQS